MNRIIYVIKFRSLFLVVNIFIYIFLFHKILFENYFISDTKKKWNFICFNCKIFVGFFLLTQISNEFCWIHNKLNFIIFLKDCVIAWRTSYLSKYLIALQLSCILFNIQLFFLVINANLSWENFKIC